MADDKAAIEAKAQKYLTKSDWSSALAELKKLNAILKGQDLRIRMKMADCLARLGKNDEAVREYTTVADLYAEKGFTVQAIAVNKVIVKIDPSRKDVHKKLAELQGERGFIPQGPAAPNLSEPVKKEEKKEVARKSAVPTIPLFSDLTSDELAYLSEKVNVLQLQAGSMIFKEGDPGNSLFIITHGDVKILSKNKKGEDVELARLKNGEFFGEFAYFSNSMRQASAVAAGEAELLEITRDILNDVSKKHPRVNEVLLKFYKQRVADKLMATSQLFKDLSPLDRHEILQKLTFQRFEPGELVIQEGCPGDYLYLIKSGKADVTSWRDGQDMLLATIGEGEFFGEISLVTGAPRTASVRANTDLETLRISKADLDVIAGKYPKVKKVIDDIIAKRVEDTIKTVLEMNKLWENGLV